MTIITNPVRLTHLTIIIKKNFDARNMANTISIILQPPPSPPMPLPLLPPPTLPRYQCDYHRESSPSRTLYHHHLKKFDTKDVTIIITIIITTMTTTKTTISTTIANL
ncbi:hypothetical protein ElyMa_006432000 [Elysia marginata]|uniref:Uncharacterized protein n=1 Tax=Elysia marginata TaxID=1093978 RepID=A0AAV4HUE4_9GAST|nr:hypothetical protein ElyMa_006432000 [Elysia marginata]